MGEAPMPGRAFAGFRIESRIGAGSLGVVFQATRPGYPAPIALKVLPKESTAENPFFEAEVLQEIREAQGVLHANTVRVLEGG
ncbi:MAG: serine/threonine protein kinase, partial [Planctomycetes bacterium]|nr:serine/threonine protein kinase [Planctomycetota bacterium]